MNALLTLNLCFFIEKTKNQMKKEKTEIKNKNSPVNSKRNLKKENTVFEMTYFICNFDDDLKI